MHFPFLFDTNLFTPIPIPAVSRQQQQQQQGDVGLINRESRVGAIIERQVVGVIDCSSGQNSSIQDYYIRCRENNNKKARPPSLPPSLSCSHLHRVFHFVTHSLHSLFVSLGWPLWLCRERLFFPTQKGQRQRHRNET